MKAHNLFGFDLYHIIKGYVASAWCSKEIKIGGSNLTQTNFKISTNTNFSNITGEVKFIGTLKYYQKSLGKLASTLSDEEKRAVKTLTEQVFNQHYYFSEIWPYLGNYQKNKVLKIVSEGKGIILYELIAGMNLFF